MPFPRSVREEALVRSARHCCVCRRYKGLVIEVHHIHPESEGGSDSIDNAIALCMDCHAAAGHYNPQHPRGNKFRRTELLKHKQFWENLVGDGKVAAQSETNPGIHTSYLICKDAGALIDLLLYRKDQIPFSYDYVLKSTATKLFADVGVTMMQSSNEIYSNSLPGEKGDGYYSDEQNFRKELSQHGLDSLRPILPSDLDSGLIRSPLLSILQKDGVDISQVGTVSPEFDEGGCMGYGWYVSIALRALSFLFSRITNFSERPLPVVPVVSRLNQPIISTLAEWGTVKGETFSYPSVLLERGQTLLIPQAILLSSQPFEPDHNGLEETSPLHEIEKFSSYAFLMAATLDNDCLVVSPSTRLEYVECDLNNISIHNFDPTLSYALDRYWEGASCPHLLFRKGGHWFYVQELFGPANPTIERIHEIWVADGIDCLRIVEIEFEITTISKIEFNGKILLDKVTLLRGQHVDVPLKATGLLRILGWYTGGQPAKLWSKRLAQQESQLRAYVERIASVNG